MSDSTDSTWFSRLTEDGPELAPDFVPGVDGAGDTTHEAPRSSARGAWSAEEAQALALELEKLAEREATALAQGRSLLIASRLFSLAGEPERAESAAWAANERAPKLSLAALEYRRLRGDSIDPERLERQLEATARLASHPATRTHATLELVELLRSRGDKTRAAGVLDHTARNGSTDSRVSLGRLLTRLAAGQGSAGLELPDSLGKATSHALEILSGRDSEEPSRALRLLRIVQSLRSGQVLDAAQALLEERASVPPAQRTALTELSIALLRTRTDQRERARNLLEQLHRESPTISSCRALATLYLDLGDTTSLLQLLDNEHSFGAPFSLEEELVLRSIARAPLSISEDELRELTITSPALALALTPPTSPPAEPGERALEAARLGCLFLDWGSSEVAENTRRALFQAEQGEVALALLGLEFALLSPTQADVPLRLEELTEALEGNAAEEAREVDSVRFLTAWHLEARGETERALPIYRSFLSHPRFGLAALDGLTRLDPATAKSTLLLNFAQHTDSPEREADAHLEAALQLEESPHESRSAVGAALLDAHSSWQEPALLLTAASLAQHRADDEIYEEALSRLADERDPRLASFAKLRALLRLAAQDPDSVLGAFQELDEALQDQDPAFPWLAHWYQTDPRSSTADPSHRSRPSTWLQLLRGSRHFLQGEWEPALTLLKDSEQARPSQLLSHALRFIAERTSEHTSLHEYWLQQTQADDPLDRKYAYERLSEIDARRGDEASSLLWMRTLAEEFPEDFSTALRLEDALLFDGRAEEWPIHRDRLARLLPGSDREPYATLAGLSSLVDLDLRAAERHFTPLLQLPDPPLIALRTQFNLAKNDRDDGLVVRLAESLLEHSKSDLDSIALLLDRAFAQARLGDVRAAKETVARALVIRTDLFPVQLLRARLALQTADDTSVDALEALARCSVTPQHRADFWFEAALLRQEHGQEAEAISNFEQTLTADSEHSAAFARLAQIFLDRGALIELAQLYRKRLSREFTPQERREELTLRLHLAELEFEFDRPEEALSQLDRVLELSPQHPHALRLHVQVCTSLEQHYAAQSSLVLLRDQLDEGEEKLQVLRALGHLYDEKLGDLEKAMDAYESVLEREPQADDIARKQVQVFSRLGLGERATSLQTKLIQRATTEDDKRKDALVLAELYEKLGRDPTRAAATLERARKAWPLDAELLEASAQFMDRQGETNARRLLVDRTGKDALRALETGRLDPALLDTLSRVARIEELPSQAEAVNAARAALLGEETHLSGAGIAALAPHLDELLAPPVLSTPLRRLLEKTGAAMDTAFSIDLAALKAERMTQGRSLERLTELSTSLGLGAPEVFLAPSLGARCLPFTKKPLRFVIGPELETIPEPSRDYLMLRALKLQLLGAGALARSRPEDAWPMLAALLLLFAPTWSPSGLDARKVAQARALIEQGLARVGYDDDVPTLALETIGALGARGNELFEAVRLCATHAAALAIGNPSDVLIAMSAGSEKPLPLSGPPRFRWIESHPEAREVLLFTCGDAHARVREQLGLAPVRAHRAPVLPPRATSLGPAPPRRT